MRFSAMATAPSGSTVPLASMVTTRPHSTRSTGRASADGDHLDHGCRAGTLRKLHVQTFGRVIAFLARNEEGHVLRLQLPGEANHDLRIRAGRLRHRRPNPGEQHERDGKTEDRK